MHAKKLKSIAVLLAAGAAVVFSATSQAQYVGPSTHVAAHSVAEVLKNPVDDQAVVLRGTIIKKVGNEKYIFTDGTGEIRVEIDDKHFAHQRFDAQTKVELRGEIEKDFLESPEVDVDALIALN
jgi:uncharacterized protein (TIGR00156 family)